jgi:hypothetical protein
MKKNMNFNFQPLSTFIFFIFHKMASLKDIHPLKIYQHTKYYGPTLTGATFAPTSDVWASAILEWFNYNCLLLEGHQQTNETLNTEFVNMKIRL